MTMRLSELIHGLEWTWHSGPLDADIAGISYDSRNVQKGFVFVCMPGLKTDGHQYIDAAIAGGASAVITAHPVQVPADVTCIVINDTRRAIAELASRFYRAPSRDVNVIGVTGTNGKTTTTHLIKAILEKAGHNTAIMGTLYAQAGSYQKVMGHTTPEAADIQAFLALCRDQGFRYVVMEVSSHALDQMRVEGIHFKAAVFTNLTQDHLDYHRDMEAYKQAKLRLFHMIPDDDNHFCVVNQDDPAAGDFIAAAGKRCYTYSINGPSDYQAAEVETNLQGTRFSTLYNQEKMQISMRLIGMFSVYNAMAAIAFAGGEGLPAATVVAALEGMKGIPGRFEEVFSRHDFTVVVDYAHTPDGLENILKTGKALTRNRMITVFGCGGDRDPGKRPMMGEIAARYSDFCVVTSDNPRSEEPEAIIADIVPGLDRVPESRYAIIADRTEAIRHAIHLAKPGDLVIIAGKGHETYQLVKDKVLDFDDRLVAARILEERS